MGEWKLKAGNLDIAFLSTKSGSLGVKFNSSKKGGHLDVFAPGETTKKIPLYNSKNPQKDFYETRYTDGENHFRAEDIQRKWFDKEKPTVLLSLDKMQKQYPLTKEAKVIAKQPMSKLNLSNVSASDGYFLLPRKDYENIQRYKKLIEYLGDDFAITSPIRLRVGSTTDHRYAIFVDKSKNAVVAIEVLVKDGMRPEPTI